MNKTTKGPNDELIELIDAAFAEYHNADILNSPASCFTSPRTAPRLKSRVPLAAAAAAAAVILCAAAVFAAVHFRDGTRVSIEPAAPPIAEGSSRSEPVGAKGNTADGADNASADSSSSAASSQTVSDNADAVDIENTVSSYEQLAVLLAGEGSTPTELLEDTDTGTAVTLYCPSQLPSGFALRSISAAGSFVNYYFNDSESGEQLRFSWGIRTSGDKYLDSCIKAFGLEPLPFDETKYYSLAADDGGTEIYQIYWSEYGCFFQLNIPVRCIDPEAPSLPAVQKRQFKTQSRVR